MLSLVWSNWWVKAKPGRGTTAAGATWALQFTTVHYISLHLIAFHCISLHFTAFHYILLHFTTFHCILLYYTAFSTLKYCSGQWAFSTCTMHNTVENFTLVGGGQAQTQSVESLFKEAQTQGTEVHCRWTLSYHTVHTAHSQCTAFTALQKFTKLHK